MKIINKLTKEEITSEQAYNLRDNEKINIDNLEKEIFNLYLNGKYCPTGSDGGVMSYITCCIDGLSIHASITNDSEIQKIRIIWELSINDKEIYNYKKEYYKLRI